jgi:phosphonate metabolism protein PhnN/1,5-bisphosphokinase (PRPP-forming)
MLVLVVGASGAGKDTLIAAAREALAGDSRFVFPKRVVTREVVAALEDHETLTTERFSAAEAAGAFALSWDAHGLRYGLPARLTSDLAAGQVVVVNASRTMVAAAVAKFPATRVLLIEAALEIRAARLASRGRESAPEIAARLRRDVDAPLPGAVRIDNSGPLAQGTARFLEALRTFAGH